MDVVLPEVLKALDAVSHRVCVFLLLFFIAVDVCHYSYGKVSSRQQHTGFFLLRAGLWEMKHDWSDCG